MNRRETGRKGHELLFHIAIFCSLGFTNSWRGVRWGIIWSFGHSVALLEGCVASHTLDSARQPRLEGVFSHTNDRNIDRCRIRAEGFCCRHTD